MNRARLYINIKLLLLAVLTLNLSGCELDERVDDLTGGYEGAFIDRLTGEKVATEYYGAKLKLLDLEYGNVATDAWILIWHFEMLDGVFWERVAVKTYSKLSDSGYNVRPFFAF